jgi:hypothetical protein
MTVSLALRQSREVSATTRRRILRLAQARGYRPDPAIVRLMHHLRLRGPTRAQANLAGIIGARWSRPEIPVSFMTRLCDGLTARARQLGYSFTRLSTDDYPGDGQLGRVLASRGIEGLIVLPLLRPMDLSGLLDWSAFSVVAATPSLLAPRFHAVMPNHFDNMLASPRDWDSRVRHRWSGGMAWHNAFGGSESVAPLITPGAGPDLDPAALAGWLRREQPDAVITDAVSRSQLMHGLAQFPARVRPKIITMNWPDAQYDAGLDQRPEHLGACAIDVLAGQLTRGEKGIPAVASSTLIDGEWKGHALVPRRPGRRKSVRK